jgi:hypothetical protein
MNTLKTEQDPIFLRGVEENPKPSVYRDLIENAKAAHHLAALSHTLMHKECPISAGLRELIAAYTFVAQSV